MQKSKTSAPNRKIPFPSRSDYAFIALWFSLESLKTVKSDYMKSKQIYASEVKKSKKVTQDCKQWEKKSEELEKALQKSEDRLAEQEEDFK